MNLESWLFFAIAVLKLTGVKKVNRSGWAYQWQINFYEGLRQFKDIHHG